MKREFIDYLQDILEEINALEDFVKGMEQAEFIKDRKTVHAAIRSFEVMGEAVTKIPAAVKNKHPEVPWRLIAGMRNKLIHEYFGVDKNTLWITIKEDIPKLRPLIEKMLDDYGRGKTGRLV